MISTCSLQTPLSTDIPYPVMLPAGIHLLHASQGTGCKMNFSIKTLRNSMNNNYGLCFLEVLGVT
jgi:hypothetical protein